MLTYSALREIQKKEMESAALVKVQEDFYEQVAELIAKKKDEAVVSKSILTIKEYENIKKIMMSIQAKREEKIVLMAVRSKIDAEGLTAQEKKMLSEMGIMIYKNRATINESWSSEENESATMRRIRVIKEVDQYKGLDNVVYGPFKVGEQPLLPGDEVDWLLKARMAEVI